MKRFDIVRRRLAQQLGRRSFVDPCDVVRSFGAVQAQDYLGALWAVGLRVGDATERDVERALADRRIVRTWPARGTLHFVAAADVRWMLELMTPHVIARAARRFAQLGLDEADFARSRKVLTRVLRGGRLTRKAVYQALDAARVSTAGQRGIHILWRLAQEGLICFGARQGKEHTFVLLEEWLPPAKRLPHDAALAEVSLRYFTGHGPATLADFTWWSGLPASKARSGLEQAKSLLERETVGGHSYWFARGAAAAPRSARSAHLLPAFDEYLVGYKDRSAVVEARAVNDGGGMLAPTLILEGRVVATWRRALRGDAVVVTMNLFAPLGPPQARAMARVVRDYGTFLGRAASVVVHSANVP